MQAINGIQNAMINTNAGAQSGMVVDAANAHRSYLRHERPCEVRPVSKQSLSGDAHFDAQGSGAPKQELPPNGTSGTCPQTMRRGRTWRFDSRQLPEAAWAMLVLNRSMCG